MALPPSAAIRLLIRPEEGETSVLRMETMTAAEMKYGRKLMVWMKLWSLRCLTSLRNREKMIGTGKTTTTESTARITVFLISVGM